MNKYKKNSKGLYRTSVTTAQGKRYITAKTIAELEQKKSEIKNASAPTEQITFSEYSKKWQTTYKSAVSVRTKEMYALAIKHACGLAECAISDITRADIQRIINKHSETPRTAEQMLLTLRQIFASAVKDNIISNNPTTDIALPRHVKQTKRALTADEKTAIRNAQLTAMQRCFIDILYSTGMRPAEMYALTWDDVNVEKSVITISKSLGFIKSCTPILQFPKTDSGIRTVYLTEWALESVLAWKIESTTPTLFGTATEAYRTKHGYMWIWEQCKRAIESELGHKTDISQYTFRHNFATVCYYSDITLLEARRLLGHSDSAMLLKIYAHLDEQKENTLDKLNKSLF